MAASEHALQGRGGLGEPACIGEPRCLEQVSVEDVSHVLSMSFRAGTRSDAPVRNRIGVRRQWVGVGGVTLSVRSGGGEWSAHAVGQSGLDLGARVQRAQDRN
jgi:hypothetical protein